LTLWKLLKTTRQHEGETEGKKNLESHGLGEWRDTLWHDEAHVNSIFFVPFSSLFHSL
jgi:hypothetical protein